MYLRTYVPTYLRAYVPMCLRFEIDRDDVRSPIRNCFPIMNAVQPQRVPLSTPRENFPERDVTQICLFTRPRVFHTLDVPFSKSEMSAR